MDTMTAELIAGLAMGLCALGLVLIAAYGICKLTRACKLERDYPLGEEAGRKPGIKYTAEANEYRPAPAKGAGLPARR